MGSPIFLIDDEPVVKTNGNGHSNGVNLKLNLDTYIADFNSRIVSAYERAAATARASSEKP